MKGRLAAPIRPGRLLRDVETIATGRTVGRVSMARPDAMTLYSPCRPSNQSSVRVATRTRHVFIGNTSATRWNPYEVTPVDAEHTSPHRAGSATKSPTPPIMKLVSPSGVARQPCNTSIANSFHVTTRKSQSLLYLMLACVALSRLHRERMKESSFGGIRSRPRNGADVGLRRLPLGARRRSVSSSQKHDRKMLAIRRI
jgi:hypothetical protein